MLPRWNHKPEKSDLNVAAKEKAREEDMEHRWALTLTLESTCLIKNAGVILLG